MNLIANLFLLDKERRAEKEIGYKLAFKDIPSLWVNSIMKCGMTHTWRSFGLDIVRGTNYFTFGKVKNGVSSRFLHSEPQYQSWLGGYVVKLKPGQKWGLQEHLNLAVADQKSWLRRYGDPNPLSEFEEETCLLKDRSFGVGDYTGVLYENSCFTHSDVGEGYNKLYLRLTALAMASELRYVNPSLQINSNNLLPRDSGKSYEMLKLNGYFCIIDVEEDVKVVLYGNGLMVSGEVRADTFELIKGDIERAMRSCRIIKV